MNVKRWFPWVCLAMMLGAELFLFRANRQKDAVQTQLHDTLLQLHQTEADFYVLKNSDVGLQASEILRLRKQNEILTNELMALEVSLFKIEAANDSNATHLATARLAIRLQQEHLLELEQRNSAIMNIALSSATNSAAIIARKTCLANLRQIDDAKQAWAMENGEADSAVPSADDLLPFLANKTFPQCPSGGKYSINAVNEAPTCSFPGHSFPPEPSPAPAGP